MKNQIGKFGWGNPKNQKNHPVLLTVLVLVSLVLVLPACGNKPVEVKDSIGNLVRFESTPCRVVSLVPTATEILFEIGASRAVAGLTYHDSTLKGAEKKAVVGGFMYPSVEKIKALNPDLVILADFHTQIKAKLESTGCRFFVYKTLSLDHGFENMLTFGQIFQKQGAAARVVQKNKDQLALIEKKLSKAVPEKKKRVMRLMGRDMIMTPGNDSFQNQMIRMAGGLPPDLNEPGSVVAVSLEQWQQFNPEVVYGCGEDRKAADLFFSQEGWKDVDAVKNHQIFYFPCELTCRAGTHVGDFVSWLSSMIYTQEFSRPENHVLEQQIIGSYPVDVDLDYVVSAVVNKTRIYDFENKTLMIEFKRPQTIVSTLEGQRTGIMSVGNHYSPPATWGPGHHLGILAIREGILKANRKEAQTTSFLITGADMGNLSVQTKRFKDMKVTALATAGVMSNAVRMSQDTGMYYEPGTINIIIMANMGLSPRAMTRAIISATEAKTAVLEDLDIRSTYTPQRHRATGTGTDNVLVVAGEGPPIDNTGGHSKMGELIAKAVYDAVKEAIYNQNKVTENRHIFQRLKERHLSVYTLTGEITCECMAQKGIEINEFSQQVDHLLLEPEYAAFLEAAFALSDNYERGLIKDLTRFDQWCLATASRIAGKPVDALENLVTSDTVPLVIQSALNSIFTGTMEKMSHE